MRESIFSQAARATWSGVPLFFDSSRRANDRVGARSEWKAQAARLLPGTFSLTGLAACTYLSFYFHQGFAFTGFLFLLPVVAAAMYGGFRQATFISIAASASLNYFFVPPIFSFVNSAANWAALGAFEFTALVISRLSQRAQQRAAEAIAERRDMERLYQTSRRMLLLNNAAEPGHLITALVRETFDFQAVQLFDAQSGATFQSGTLFSPADQQIRNAYIANENSYDFQTRTWYCVLRLGARPVGGLALNGTQLTELAATALASLIAIALERARALEGELRAQAARETEQLRTAVLDALAHDFKTPLTVTRTASSGLLTLGGLNDLQTELITLIDKQARKLDELSSRLLRAAMLDGAEFHPRRQPLLVSDVIDAAIASLTLEASRDRFRVTLAGRELPVSADREVILTALGQLLDNALKYSEPESVVEILVTVKTRSVVLTVTSKGVVLAQADRERIFERFYRTAHQQHLPSGTGLGLSIVKKIAEAHRGSVWAEGISGYGTSISFSLPLAAESLQAMPAVEVS